MSGANEPVRDDRRMPGPRSGGGEPGGSDEEATRPGESRGTAESAVSVDRRPTRRDALILLGGAGLVAACGGKAKAPGPAVPVTTAGSTPPPPAAPAPPAVFPLTGLPVDQTGRVGRPVITVKIDNAPAARPQAGLDAADLVFEEVVEGGVVRFAAVFHSGEAGSVGPVRSVRAEDAILVTPLRGYFVYSGGNDVFNAIIQKAPVGIITEDDKPAFFNRRRDRKQPYNLFTSTGAIYGKAEPRREVPPAFFSYRPAGQPLASAAPTSDLTVTMGERTTSGWGLDPPSGRWLRTTNGTPHVLEGGARLSFPNVMIQFCRYQDTNVKDTSGTISPEAVLVGDGDAWLLSGPALAKGRWARPDAGSVTRYTDVTGKPMELLPGPTWVMFAPVGAPTVVR